VSLTIGTVVAALVLKAAEKVGEQTAGSGWAALGKLVELVRRRFSDTKDEPAAAALVRVQDPPAGERQLATLAEAVDRHAGHAPEFAQELRRLIREGESAGVDIQHVTQTAWGDRRSARSRTCPARRSP
jgi:hypothetical protein